MCTAALLYVCTSATGGLFSYALDDTYIHLELAWQLISSGTWGINPGEPASASSSPVWSLVLAGVLAFVGHQDWAAAALATVAALAAVAAGSRLLASQHTKPAHEMAALAALVILVPVPVMAVLGMEHALQLALVLAVADHAGRSLAPGSRTPPSLAGLVLLALLCGTRYEGTFLAVTWSVLLLGHRRWKGAATVLAAATVPLALFGLLSISMGNSPVPNGMLMKSAPLDGRPGENLLRNLYAGAAVYLPAALFWTSESVRKGSWRGTGQTRLLAGTASLHLLLASVGWYYRYEAWLVGWGVLAATASVLALGRTGPVETQRARGLLVGALAFMALGATSLRAWRAWSYLPGRTQYTADAKVRLARALEATAPDTVVALHDIGAMAWETDLRIIDTAALGSNRVLALHESRAFTGSGIAEIVASEGGEVGLSTASWMLHDPPPGWRPAARFVWRLDEARTSTAIVAYALRPGSEETVQRWLAKAVGEMEGRGTLELWTEAAWHTTDPGAVQ